MRIPENIHQYFRLQFYYIAGKLSKNMTKIARKKSEFNTLNQLFLK
jgi:hypothetical protein